MGEHYYEDITRLDRLVEGELRENEGLTQGVRMQNDHYPMECDTVEIGEASGLAGD